MATIFTRIIDGEIPGTFVYEDDRVVAFLDIEPMTDGHVLVVPREEIEHWIDMPEDLTAHVMHVAQRIGKAQKAAFDCPKVGVLIQGYEVPHVHVHVWPTYGLADFDPRNKGPMAEPAVLQANAEKIVGALS